MNDSHYQCPACGHDLDVKYACSNCLRNFRDDITYNEAYGALTERQVETRDMLDRKLSALIQHYAIADQITEESLEKLRKHFLDVMSADYHIPAYDIYPWMIPNKAKLRRQTPKPEIVTIKAKHGQVIEIAVPLVDQVPDKEELYAGDMNVTVRIINNQIEVEAPDVETYNEPPGKAIPILIEQSHGKLHMVAWDKDNEDPFLDVSWLRALGSHEALAEARREAVALTEENQREMGELLAKWKAATQKQGEQP